MNIGAADLLRTYSAPSVQRMARKRGVQVKGSAKEPIVAALSKVLYDRESINRALEDLAPNERRLVELLVLTGGEAPTAQILALMEQEGQVDKPDRTDRYSYYYHQPTGSIQPHGSRRFEDVVARASAYCLVFTTEHLGGYGSTYEHGKPGRRLFIPDGILQHLARVTLPVETVAVPPVIREADPSLLLRDFYLLLSYASREPIPVTARGPIVKKTLLKLNQSLRYSEDTTDIRSEDDLSWIPLLRALALELGLLGQSVGELVLDPRAGDYLRLPANERRKRLFDAYRKTSHFFEVFRIGGMTVKGKTVSLRAAPAGAVTARQRILTELLELPTGEWISFDHLVGRMRTRAYEFLLPRRRSAYYYSYSSHGNPYETFPYASDNSLGVSFEFHGNDGDYWNRVEGEFVWVVVSEVLHALGVVDLGGDEKNITAFRITEDGACLLRDEPPLKIETTPQVVIQPNFQIFAFEPTGEDVLFTLDQIADRISSQQAIEYELTRDSVYRAQRAGLDAATIITFLEAVSSVGLPQNVRRSLEEWGGQIERVTLRRRTPLLQTPDEATLDALYADPQFAPLLGRRVAPTAAIVTSDNLRLLSDYLIAAGRLPALTEGADSTSTPSRLSVSADGTIVFRQKQPSLFDLQLLRPFTHEQNGHLHLTPDSLRRAARSKLTADEMIATLERLQAEYLLPEVAAFIRRWAKDWGRGALLETVILQVEQPETLADLLADPELKPHLQSVPNAPTLALVKSESINRVRELLNARGMALSDRLLR